MNPTRATAWTRWLSAAVFLLVTATALVHELEHTLDHHDEPFCALHLFADHTGKTSVAAPAFAAPVFHPVLATRVAEQPSIYAIASPFRSRAPPSSPV